MPQLHSSPMIEAPQQSAPMQPDFVAQGCESLHRLNTDFGKWAVLCRTSSQRAHVVQIKSSTRTAQWTSNRIQQLPTISSPVLTGQLQSMGNRCMHEGRGGTKFPVHERRGARKTCLTMEFKNCLDRPFHSARPVTARTASTPNAEDVLSGRRAGECRHGKAICATASEDARASRGMETGLKTGGHLTSTCSALLCTLPRYSTARMGGFNILQFWPRLRDVRTKEDTSDA
ncbi:hypothetical protein QBC46DRAFT_383527 [Diplogelasinospora grovesii]|uniref:Uncharacterized protein n=1 Tax=Diplogelasinospora grovesii TaxID=303347 RepID=A0AAN6S4V1_9PEZI|nr:hypothetical protein QBC46DRAFT_383527 [Diplogelasinospora grovesii]